MKTAKTLTELAQELDRQKDNKNDFIADTRELSVSTNGAFVLNVSGGPSSSGLPVAKSAQRQITDRVGIPAKYADRLAEEAPELLATNINHWFENKPERRMVRQLDGVNRAFLSDRYQRIDNLDVANAVVPVLQEEVAKHGMELVSCEVTAAKLYIKATTPRLSREVSKKDDIVQAGVVITNSEIGFGAVRVEPLLYRLWCLNGCVINDLRFSRHHVGARASSEEAIYQLLSDEALAADDNAILLKVRDVVRAALSETVFNNAVDRLVETTERKIEGDVVKAVEVLGKTVGLTQGENTGVLKHLIEGGDLTQYGLLNAVTRFSQDVDNYDRASDLERIGGKVLDLAPGAWREIAQAA